MAKSAKTAIKKDPKQAAEAKNYTKVIRAVRSPKTGAYTFKEQMVHKDKVKDFLAQKQFAPGNLLKAVRTHEWLLFFGEENEELHTFCGLKV